MKNLKERLREALESLTKSGIIKDFYLAGGTALYLKYNHRKSYDLDFFTFPNKSPDFTKVAAHIVKLGGRISNLREDTIYSEINGVSVSFFEYNYKLIEEVSLYERIPMASDIDIACMKSIAIIQRGSKKDFFDLCFLMKLHNWELSYLSEKCKEKYGGLFNPDIFLKALVFFDDAEKEKIPEIEDDWESIKKYFQTKVKEILT